MFDRRRRLAAAFFVLPLWTGALAYFTIAAAPASAGTVTTTNSCTNNAQAGTSALPVTVAGEATPNPAAAGVDTITLSGATFGIDVPAGTLLAGYSLGLLSIGVNNIPANVTLTLLGSNTTEATQTLPPLSVTGTTTITDPTPENKTSGDESATPLSVSADLPASTWTPTGGDVGISLGTSSTSALVGPGGIITVTFSCTPGTPTPAGCGPAPLAPCTGTNAVPALAFTTVVVTGGSTTSSTSSTSTSSTSTTSTSTTTTSTTAPTSTTSTTVPIVPTEVTGSAAFPSTCRNSVTPDVSELLWEVTGTTLSPVLAGSPASLTSQSWRVTVPASVLQTGINLGLLHAGDSPAGVAKVSVFASNTKEGTVAADPVAVSVGPITLDGNGMALPAATTFAVPDMTWTSVGGNVSYSMAGTSVDVAVGPLTVTFTCEPKEPVASIVTTGVRGATDIKAAQPTTTTTPAAAVLASTTEPLAATGATVGVPLALAVGLLDLGYLFATAARPSRRQARNAAR